MCIRDSNKYYDMSVFNRCIETGNVLLILECWQDVHVHPALVSIPVDVYKRQGQNSRKIALSFHSWNSVIIPDSLQHLFI